MGEKSREPGAGEPGGSPGGAPKSRRSQSLILGGDRREEMMFEAHADIAIGADAKVIADEILDTLDEPALKRMASCHGLKTQVAGMSASGGRSTGGKERLRRRPDGALGCLPRGESLGARADLFWHGGSGLLALLVRPGRPVFSTLLRHN